MPTKVRRSVLGGLLLILTQLTPGVAQSSERFFVEGSVTYSLFPSELPIEYLNSVSGRSDAQGPAAPDAALGLGARVGLVTTNGIVVAGAFDFVPTDVVFDAAATRSGADLKVSSLGADALFPVGSVYLVGGLGVWILDPTRAPSETALGWTPGLGFRNKLFHLEIRDRMTVMSLAPSAEKKWMHALMLSSGIALRL